MSLRPYQSACLQAIQAAHQRGCNRQLIVLPTGSGKSVLFAHLTDVLPLMPWQSMLFLVHLDQLIWQAAEKFKKYNPDLCVEVEKAESRADPNADIIVASVQSIGKQGSARLTKFDPANIRLVVLDEAHHCTSRTTKNILSYFGVLKGESNFDPTKVLTGWTATPSRADGIGLEAVFEEIVYHKPIREMIGEGWLVDLECFRIETTTDISDVKLASNRDFQVGALERTVNVPERNKLIVRKYEELGKGLPALAFTVDIQHSEDLASTFREAGYTAHPLSSRTPEQEVKRLVRQFKDGEIDVLTSCAKISEGFDAPRATVGLMARPTKSSTLFCQQLGRLLRPFPAPEDRNLNERYVKDKAIILDFADLSGAHDLVQSPSLFGLPPRWNTKGKPITEALEEVEQLQLQYPHLRVRDYHSIEEMRAVVTSVDLFKLPTIPALAKKNGAKLNWLEEADGVFRIALPDRNLIRVRINTLGQFEVVRSANGVAHPLRVLDTPREAFTFAESLVDADQARVLKAKAGWHNDQPTESQCALLWRKDPAIKQQFKHHRDLFAFALKRCDGGDAGWTKGGISRRLDVVLHQEGR